MSLRGRGGRSRIQRGRGRPSGEKRENISEKKLSQRIYENKNDFKLEYSARPGAGSSGTAPARRFAFENETKPNELEPIIKHEISENCFIQDRIPHFLGQALRKEFRIQNCNSKYNMLSWREVFSECF